MSAHDIRNISRLRHTSGIALMNYVLREDVQRSSRSYQKIHDSSARTDFILSLSLSPSSVIYLPSSVTPSKTGAEVSQTPSAPRPAFFLLRRLLFGAVRPVVDEYPLPVDHRSLFLPPRSLHPSPLEHLRPSARHLRGPFSPFRCAPFALPPGLPRRMH